MKQFIFVCLLVLALAIVCSASTVSSRDYTCPICGKEFSADCQISQTLITSFTQLDGKPFGAAIVPDLLPLCPRCHFPQIQQELDEELITNLREYVESEEYQQLAEGNTSYFLLAKIAEHLGSSMQQIGQLYQQACWQVDGGSIHYQDNPVKFREYADLAINYFDQEAFDWLAYYGTVCADLERKSGRMLEADVRLLELKELPLTEERLQVIDFELQLIEAGDSNPHFLSEARGDTLPWSQPDSTAVEQP